MAAATRSRTMDSRRSRRRGFGGTSPHIKGEMAQTVTPQHQPVQVDRTFWLVTIGLTLLNVILTVVIILLPMDYLLPGASLHVADRGDDIDFLYKFMSVFGNAIFVYVVGYIIYFAIAFRRRPDEPLTTIGVQIHDQPKLELWWTIIPSILIIILGAMSVRVWYAVQFGTGAPALTVEVIGHQFNYEFRYPGLSDSYYSTTEPMHLLGSRARHLLRRHPLVLGAGDSPQSRRRAGPGAESQLHPAARRHVRYRLHRVLRRQP
jgi:hypothetical protein